MPRLPYVPEDLEDPAAIVDAIRERRGGKLIEADRILLHSPIFARGWNDFARTVRRELSLEPLLRELAVCGIAVLNGADYELYTHEPDFRKAGGTAAQFQALQRFEEAANDAVLFSAAQRATMWLTIEMTRDLKVSHETFEAVRAALPGTQQIVELVGTIGFYNMVSRFMVALDIHRE